ncbi:MAG: signal peptide peptidase SppA [Muribaculaceae bacterium]|nr:signal peptide peptidase SppA [Muribaculaceae bacterium]
MLKRFFISFLGTMAGIWLSVIIGGVLMFAIIGVATMSSVETPTQAKAGSVLRIKLAGEVADRYEPGPILDRLYGGIPEILPLNTLLSAIEKASSDDRIEGIYLDCGGVSVGLAQAQAIISALDEFKESGKWVYAYADNYSQADYFIASSTADSLFVNPQGMIDVHGLSSTTMYFKDLLDKVGVKVQVVKVGTFKSAVEPFILNDMSEANRLQQEYFLGQMWGNMMQTMAAGRGVDTTAVMRWADSFSYTKPSVTYVKERMADKVLYRHEMDEFLAKATGVKKVNNVDYDTYVKAPSMKSGKGAAKIALLYATGDITENASDAIASERLVPEILKLAENDDIDGLVLRVNSPGGSAYASEQIWEALATFKKRTGKPFYVSMGDYAASGGYYISCGADRIYAEPLTLTGSIGIFGMIPDASGLMNDKLGIHTATVSTSKGQFPSLINAMTPEQAAAMQNYVNRGYETFVKRCADGRKMSVDSIKAIAEGRVWDGATARRIGLVDKIGGLSMVLADMAEAINKDSGTDGYTVREYPKVNLEWWDEVMLLNSQMTQMSIESELGEALPYYCALRSVRQMHPLQCRIDFMVIK